MSSCQLSSGDRALSRARKAWKEQRNSISGQRAIAHLSKNTARLSSWAIRSFVVHKIGKVHKASLMSISRKGHDSGIASRDLHKVTKKINFVNDSQGEIQERI